MVSPQIYIYHSSYYINITQNKYFIPSTLIKYIISFTLPSSYYIYIAFSSYVFSNRCILSLYPHSTHLTTRIRIIYSDFFPSENSIDFHDTCTIPSEISYQSIYLHHLIYHSFNSSSQPNFKNMSFGRLRQRHPTKNNISTESKASNPGSTKSKQNKYESPSILDFKLLCLIRLIELHLKYLLNNCRVLF